MSDKEAPVGEVVELEYWALMDNIYQHQEAFGTVLLILAIINISWRGEGEVLIIAGFNNSVNCIKGIIAFGFI